MENGGFFENFFNMSITDINKCSMFNLKFILLIIFVTIILKLLFFPYTYSVDYFENNESEYKSNLTKCDMTFKAELTSDTSILSGLAYKNIYGGNIYFDISSNLYILNGNPFSNDTISNDGKKTGMYTGGYKVYLLNDNVSKLLLLGELGKETSSDHIYKLKISDTDILKYKNYDQVVVMLGDKIVLKGSFVKN